MCLHHHSIWNLISKKLAGEASEEILQELDAFLPGHPELQYVTEILSDLFQTTAYEHTMDEEAAFEKLLIKMKQSRVSF
jgi:hypothetical protein